MAIPRALLITLIAGMVAIAFGLYSYSAVSSVGVIGGSDGPTAVFVTTHSVNPAP